MRNEILKQAGLLGVVILNWKAYDETIGCIHSLVASGICDANILVLDNGSANGSVEKIHSYLDANSLRDEHFQRYSNGIPACRYNLGKNVVVTVLAGLSNLGFAGGCNLAVSALLEEGRTRSILFLNSDARIVAGDIKELIRISEAGKFIVGPVIRDESGSEVVFSGYRWPYLLFSKGKLPVTSDMLQVTSYVEGSVCLVTSEFVLKKISRDGFLFDEKYFLYCEDVDLCMSASTFGFTCVIASTVSAKHKVSASSGGKGNPTAYYYMTRNRIYLANKWMPFPLALIFHLYYIPSRLILILLHKLRGASQETVRAVWSGLFDGYLGKFYEKVN